MKVRISALALLAVAAAGCAPKEEQGTSAEAEPRRAEQPAAVLQAGPAQNKTTVTVPAGGQLVVALPGNRSTGYYWEVVARPANLAAAGEEYVQDASAPGTVGAGGTEKFTFRAERTGSGPLRLEHKSPGGGTVAEAWQADIVVR